MMGALTTFSTFAVETFFLMKNGLIIESIVNMSLNLFGTIILAAAGFKIVQAIYG
jgi:CrcB protein